MQGFGGFGIITPVVNLQAFDWCLSGLLIAFYQDITLSLTKGTSYEETTATVCQFVFYR